MKRIFFLLSFVILSSCVSRQVVTITKLKGSPIYDTSELKLVGIDSLTSNNAYNFSFQAENFALGEQTEGAIQNGLANSSKGQHIHFIINNDPYSAHYDSNFSKELEADNNVILAFLSRSYHESVKNEKAYVLTQISNDKSQEIDLTKQFLFYSRPKGVYKGDDTKKLLLDFYLVNTNLSSKGNKVRLTITQRTFTHQFLLDSWEPYYIEGLDKGTVNLKLELLNKNMDLIESDFNPSLREIILE